MIRFNYILWIGYISIVIISYIYLRNSYFPQSPTKLEKLVMVILASVWLVSVPITFIIKQGDESYANAVKTSYDGFVGREA